MLLNGHNYDRIFVSRVINTSRVRTNWKIVARWPFCGFSVTFQWPFSGLSVAFQWPFSGLAFNIFQWNVFCSHGFKKCDLTDQYLVFFVCSYLLNLVIRPFWMRFLLDRCKWQFHWWRHFSRLDLNGRICSLYLSEDRRRGNPWKLDISACPSWSNGNQKILCSSLR